MHTITNYILWLLASIVGFVFGIFLASSLGLHEPLYIFSLAAFFGIIFVIISYSSTKFFINQVSGRGSYLLAGQSSWQH
jgi:hypothetical protein